MAAPSKTTPRKRPASSLDTGADFLGFEPEPEVETAEPAPKRKKDKRLPIAQKRDKRGQDKRRAIDIDLEATGDDDNSPGAQPWDRYVSWHLINDATAQINAELGAFHEYMSPTAAEHQLRAEIIDSIARAIQGRYPDARVLPFGSFATQSYLPYGDIDLVVISQQMATMKVQRVLYALSAMLQTRGLARDVTVIARARVPILKFVSVRANVRIDISLNQEGGLRAVPIVNTLLEDNGGRAARAMVAFIKAYLRGRDLNEVFSGGISSFSVICLVVNFLQLHPRVRTGQIDPLENMGLLLIEFFELYGKNFNYDVVGISVVNGGSYFGKDSRQWPNKTARQSGIYLCIEDPGDSNNDIASGAYNTYAIRQAFIAAYDALSNALQAREEALVRSRDDRRMPGYLQDPSLLGAIYAMSLADIAKRKSNAQEAAAATRHRAPVTRLPPLQMQPTPSTEDFPAPPLPMTSKRKRKRKKKEKDDGLTEAQRNAKRHKEKNALRKELRDSGMTRKEARSAAKRQMRQADKEAAEAESSELSEVSDAPSPPVQVVQAEQRENRAARRARERKERQAAEAETSDLSEPSGDPRLPKRASIVRTLGIDDEREEGELPMDTTSQSSDSPEESKYSLHIRASSNGSASRRPGGKAAALVNGASFEAASSDDDSSDSDSEDTSLTEKKAKAAAVRDFWAKKGPKGANTEVIEIDDSD